MELKELVGFALAVITVALGAVLRLKSIGTSEANRTIVWVIMFAPLGAFANHGFRASAWVVGSVCLLLLFAEAAYLSKLKKLK